MLILKNTSKIKLFFQIHYTVNILFLRNHKYEYKYEHDFDYDYD